MRFVIGLAGKPGSGKTGIAAMLAQRYGFHTASFGDFVRNEARSRNLGSDRASLEALGEELIASLGWSEFCRRTIADATGDYVSVDGFRHLHAVRAMSEIVKPAAFALAYVSINEDDRNSRVKNRARDGDSPTDRLLEDAALSNAAALVVDGTDIAEAARELAAWAGLTADRT